MQPLQIKLDNIASNIIRLVGFVVILTMAMNIATITVFGYEYLPFVLSGDFMSFAAQGVGITLGLVGIAIPAFAFIGDKASGTFAHKFWMAVASLVLTGTLVWLIVVYLTSSELVTDIFRPLLGFAFAIAFLACVVAKKTRSLMPELTVVFIILLTVAASSIGFREGKRRLDETTAPRINIITEKSSFINAQYLYGSGSGFLIRFEKEILFVPMDKVEKAGFQPKSPE